MAFRSNFRDKQEWLKSTNNCINLNTSSDEACKSYDACLSQFIGWYDDPSLGGLNGSVEKMLQADPEFILGRALELELEILGCMSYMHPDLCQKLMDLNELVDKKKSQASEQELMHVRVVNDYADGHIKRATPVLERLNTLYPEDLAALKMAQDHYFFMGQAATSRGAVANTLSKVDSSKNPLYGYVHGMFAFALEEANMYPQAQQHALRALELVPRDTWAIHNYAHCLEMLGKTEEGLKWMLDKKADWLPCSVLSSHQYWHTSLFHINNGNFDEAVDLLDTEILPRCHKSGTGLDLHDSCSMIYRMELVDLFGKTSKEKAEKATQKDRWDVLYDFCKPHTIDHLNGFNDAHFMMAILGKGDIDLAHKFIESHDQISELNSSHITKPLLMAMLNYKLGNYEKCVDLLEPVRFEIIKLGGSHAQRDVFEQLLIVAGLRSSKTDHNQLSRRILSERELFHGRLTTQSKLLLDATA